MRRKTIPVSEEAGRRVRETFSPVCRPTPVARMTFFRVRCLIIKNFFVNDPFLVKRCASLRRGGKYSRWVNLVHAPPHADNDFTGARITEKSAPARNLRIKPHTCPAKFRSGGCRRETMPDKRPVTR